MSRIEIMARILRLIFDFVLSPKSLMSRNLFIIVSIWFVLLLSACAPREHVSPADRWDYVDLRVLSESGDFRPELDLIAGYTRLAGSDLQIRLDFLDLQLTPNADIYIALDTNPGGTNQLPIEGTAEMEWDTLLILPASGIPQALSSVSRHNITTDSQNFSDHTIRQDLIPRIIRLPWQDYILASVNLSSIPETKYGIEIQAFSTEMGSSRIADSIGPFRSDALPPAQAPLVLAFWNTFPAYTPAQSLRRWDGAHTGPYGERHGLSILLNNVGKSGVPIVLLDLRNPAALSALDYTGALPQIQQLVDQGLLVLPDSIPGSPSYPVFPAGLPDWSSLRYLEDLRKISSNFSLKSSNILYSPILLDESNKNYRLIFTAYKERDSESYSEAEILPLPPEKPLEQQATPDGLAIPFRKLLLSNALRLNNESREFPLLILGGSLLESAFGDPQSAAATMSYISNHPWIETFNSDDLISLPTNTSPQILPGTTASAPVDSFIPSAVLFNLPDPGLYSHNPLYQAAWDSAISLYAPLPPEPASLPVLRSNYSGQAGITLEAARWADNPQPRQDCKSDPDLDGILECIFATDRHFTILDPEGARLLAYYFISDNSTHQITGSTSQFIVGLADPSTWQLEAGEGADPAGIHGAFTDQPAPWSLFTVSNSEDYLEFTSPDRMITKRFTLSPSGLRIDYQNPGPLSVQIPISADPWTRSSPGWSSSYHGQSITNGYIFQLDDQIEVEILSDATVTAHSYSDSKSKMIFPEDPNFDYPQGHYVPFPMTIIDINSSQDFFVEIKPKLP
jgi:hypothetical protein